MAERERWVEIQMEIRAANRIPPTAIYLDQMAECFSASCKRIAALEQQLAEAVADRDALRAVVVEALEPGVFGEPFGMLSREAIEWPMMEPIARAVRTVCEFHGYGAVMQMASSLWEIKSPGCAHTIAAASSVRRKWIERAQVALDRAAEPRATKEAGNG